MLTISRRRAHFLRFNKAICNLCRYMFMQMQAHVTRCWRLTLSTWNIHHKSEKLARCVVESPAAQRARLWTYMLPAMLYKNFLERQWSFANISLTSLVSFPEPCSPGAVTNEQAAQRYISMNLHYTRQTSIADRPEGFIANDSTRGLIFPQADGWEVDAKTLSNVDSGFHR